MFQKSGAIIIYAFLAGFLLFQPDAQSEELTQEELTYLEEEFGVCENSPILNLLTAQERERIHNIFTFDEPWSRVYPYIFNVRLFGVLDTANIRQCNEWSYENSSPPCPPVADPTHQPGKDVADYQCNACHLFGTPDAPGFFRLAQEKNTSIAYLSEALASGHRMSPINLAAQELRDLSGYIASLTCEPNVKR